MIKQIQVAGSMVKQVHGLLMSELSNVKMSSANHDAIFAAQLELLNALDCCRRAWAKTKAVTLLRDKAGAAGGGNKESQGG